MNQQKWDKKMFSETSEVFLTPLLLVLSYNKGVIT